jgi:hypothetical protein
MENPVQYLCYLEVQDLGYLGEFDIFLGIWGGTRTMVMYKLRHQNYLTTTGYSDPVPYFLHLDYVSITGTARNEAF